LCHDVNVSNLIENEPGAIYIMDMGHVNYKRLNNIHEKKGFFVTWAKTNMAWKR